MKAFRKNTLAAACAAVLLAACGGGGGSTASTDGAGGTAPVVAATLSGTAAGGAPLVGTVTVKDSKGATKTVDIAADGAYNVDVEGMTGPFMVRATGTVGGVSVNYYSAATSDDFDNKVNVTPFTTLLVSNIAGKLAEAYYNDGNYAGVTTTSLDAAVSNLQKKLAPALEAMGLDKAIDLLRASFSANHTGLDAALDVIKVSIDPGTNIATLTNALTNTTIGTDDIASKADDAATVTLSDAEKTALATAPTELQKVQNLLKAFEALFATGLPSVSELSSSGVFDTTSSFVMGGASFAQFASDVSTEDWLVGVKVLSSDIIFSSSDASLATAKLLLQFTNATKEKLEFQLARSGSGAWKIIGDGKVADISVNPMATYNVRQPGGAVTVNSGLQMYMEVDQYNANHVGAEIDRAVIVGTGIRPAGGVIFQAAMGIPYFSIGGTGGNIIPECATPSSTNCIDLSVVSDNANYSVKVFSGSTLLNGSGYSYIVPKAALPTASLSSAQFPTLTTITIDSVNVTQLSQFVPNKTLSLAWTLPVGLVSNHLNVQFLAGTPPGAAGRMQLEDDLDPTAVSKVLPLGAAPTAATFANIWLSARDIYGREFVTTPYYPAP